MSKKTIKDMLPMIMVFVIAMMLTVIEGLLQFYDIEFRTYMQIIKGMIIWLVMPITIILVIYKIGKPYLMENKGIKIVVGIMVGVFILADLLVSAFRGMYYVTTSEMKNETVLEDGMIEATYSEFLSETETTYYEPVTVFCRKPFQGWSDEEVLAILQKRYGNNIVDKGYMEKGRGSFIKQSQNEKNIYFEAFNNYEVTENYMDELLYSYAYDYWKDQERGFYIVEDADAQYIYCIKQNLTIACENKEDIQKCAEDIADWIKYALKNEHFIKYNSNLGNIYIAAGNETTYPMIQIQSELENYSRGELKEEIEKKLQKIFTELEETSINIGTFQDNNTEMNNMDSEKEEYVDTEETINFYMSLDVAEEFQLSQEIAYRLVIVDSACGSRFYSLIGTKDSANSWQIINTDPFIGRSGVSAGITFLDEDLGFLVLSHSGGSYGEMYRTEDSL